MGSQQFSHMPLGDQMLLQERRRRRLSSRSVSALNEFDSSKYLSYHQPSVPMWDPRLPSFGLDPDAPVFANGYGSKANEDRLFSNRRTADVVGADSSLQVVQ